MQTRHKHVDIGSENHWLVGTRALCFLVRLPQPRVLNLADADDSDGWLSIRLCCTTISLAGGCLSDTGRDFDYILYRHLDLFHGYCHGHPVVLGCVGTPVQLRQSLLWHQTLVSSYGLITSQ